ncbi:uncharacterized protein Tco025E_02318 [Trypanosoma conorhini]|uniref:Uncharacterized protein n=1 Tax=Trypanosoma conorhini TaxID=83891 RepID=A0A3R7LDL4_9TRYP|nr:uncharacterized protein Tco025E_02318 [Trypanosoma conorhini]RNF25124.1 hypothetical protein Tco025E_02318 [Trypanosoma conorhini]
MTGSPLTLAWVDAHLRRRGLPRKHAPEPTVGAGEVPGAPPGGLRAAPSSSTDGAPPVEEILAAVDHRLLSGDGHPSVASGRGRPRGTEEDDRSDSKGVDILNQSQRATPQRVASGVASFVKQQAERTGSLNGPTQTCFVLHTVLTACVRHALHYSRLDSSSGLASASFSASSPAATSNVESATEAAAMRTRGAAREAVAASSQINFPWSAHVASEHLLEVMQDAAVQKGLRSQLWRAVDREHKGIMHHAIKLCSNAAPVLADIGVEEAEVRRLFGIPADVLAAAREFFDISSPCFSTCPAALVSLPRQHQLSVLSEHHFVYTTTSSRLAELLNEEMSVVKRIVREGDKSMAGVEGGWGSSDGFARQLTLLLLEMARVRMALAILLQFEALLRRCAAAGGQQQLPDDAAAVPPSPASPASLAQGLCALAAAAASRALETRPHRSRFVAHFRVVSLTPRQGRPSDARHVETPYYSLKSVFAALSQAAATTNTATAEAADVGVSAPPATPAAPAARLPAAAGVSEDSVEEDPVMRAVMAAAAAVTPGKAAPRGGATHSRPPLRVASSTATAGPLAQAQRQRRGRASAAPSASQEREPQAELTWHFRCCEGELGAVLNAVDAPPCDETEVKVQLLRPATHVPWPFRLEAVAADTNLHDIPAATSLLSTPSDTFVQPPATAAVRMRYNPAWRTAASMPTPLDTQHATRLQRVLTHRHGRLLTLNGCPAEKLKSVMRIAAQSVRLVVRFR